MSSLSCLPALRFSWRSGAQPPSARKPSGRSRAPWGERCRCPEPRTSLLPFPAPQSRSPTGVLRLEDVLRAALLRNPELSATAFGVRTAEAMALQAGLLPTPELELELENFGGTGEVRGMRAAESTVQLSQLVELGG